MIFETNRSFDKISPVSFKNIRQISSENEKKLEKLLKNLIGDEVFPDIFVFGNERKFQKEADLFAVNSQGDLILLELKVDGHYNRDKIYQVMDYAQIFSNWQYEEMNEHYKKCFNENVDLQETFQEHFGFKLNKGKFNQKQKMIVISNSSSYTVNSVAKYWNIHNIDIEEYFYRFYEYGEKYIFELSSELYWQNNSGSCWINTCKKYKNIAYFDMIKKEKAIAYGGRKDVIGEWMDRGHIFLYHNHRH